MANQKRAKKPPNRRLLTDLYIQKLKPTAKTFLVWDTKQGGLALQVTKRGTMSFKVIYRHKGRIRWYHIDRYPTIGLADARKTAKTIRAKATLGGDPHGEKVASRIGANLNHVAQAYVERYARKENKSWKQADALVRTYILPKLGHRKVRDIARRDIRAIFDAITESGRPPLANQVLAAISAVLSWATEREIIEQNPAKGIKRNKVKARTRFLSNAEIRAVWPKFDDLGLLPTTALKIIMLTGQRPGEATRMRWEDVDLDKAMWTLPGEPEGTWRGTKNARTHEVPLSAPVIALLHELGPENIGPVFPSTRRGYHMAIPSVASVWKDLDIPFFRPHDLRATAASGMDALGIQKDHISRVLNHVEGGQTAKYIRHDHLDQKRHALDIWANELVAIIGGRGKTDQKAEVVQLHKGAAS